MKISENLVKPLITEKSMAYAQKGIFTFLVNQKTNKYKIKQLVESIFKVHVVDIKTILLKGKTRTQGRLRKKVKTGNIKKAYVELKQGEKIDIFEAGK